MFRVTQLIVRPDTVETVRPIGAQCLPNDEAAIACARSFHQQAVGQAREFGGTAVFTLATCRTGTVEVPVYVASWPEITASDTPQWRITNVTPIRYYPQTSPANLPCGDPIALAEEKNAAARARLETTHVEV